MSTYLVTGGAGFLASHLIDGLVSRGDSAVALDDLSTGTAVNLEGALATGGAELVVGSVLDEALVDKLMSKVDMCVHMAAAVGVELVLSRPLESLLSNVRGTDVVLAAASRHGTPLLYASTSEVYGTLSSTAIGEDATRQLGSPFTSRWSW